MMNIDTNSIVTATEANQNFSRRFQKQPSKTACDRPGYRASDRDE